MYYKVLDGRGCSPIAKALWSLPNGNQPGNWMPGIVGGLVRCKRGYHAVPLAHLARRLFQDARVYEIETDGDTLVYDKEIVSRRMRLTRLVGVATRRALVLWACDCAERVLPLYEHQYPGDDRVRTGIETARWHVDGVMTLDELRVALDAADDAAWGADAAKIVAGDAYAATTSRRVRSAGTIAEAVNAAHTAAASAYAANAVRYITKAAVYAYTDDVHRAAAYAADASTCVGLSADNAAYAADYDAFADAADAAATRFQERTWQRQRLLERLAETLTT